jgi:uncharacterized membrane protein HdeD (DUF308 family)
MSEHQPAEAQPPKRNMAHWVTLARSILALTLGLVLILQPDKARPMLVNFIGMFWLMGGVMSLRWGVSGEQARRMSVIIGVVGIVAGVLILGRFLLAQVVGEEPMVLVLGVIIVLTGLVHVFEGFRAGPIIIGSGHGRAPCWAFSKSCWAWWWCCGVKSSARSSTPW